MLTHLLDTSAWLAHIRREPNWELVSDLLKNGENQVGISALSLIEVHAQLRFFGKEREFLDVVEDYRDLFAEIIPADEAVALRSVTLRKSASARVPSMDALIAATASSQGAILVHRDAHYLAIPDTLLKQQHLAGEGHQPNPSP